MNLMVVNDWLEGHPWGALMLAAAILAGVAGIGLMASAWITGHEAHVERALAEAREIERMMPAPGPERLTFEQKEGMLRELIAEWAADPDRDPIDLDSVRFHYALTAEQTRSFALWLAGQARRVDGVDYVALTECSVHCGWLRFRVIGSEDRGSEPEPGGLRA